MKVFKVFDFDFDFKKVFVKHETESGYENYKIFRSMQKLFFR